MKERKLIKFHKILTVMCVGMLGLSAGEGHAFAGDDIQLTSASSKSGSLKQEVSGDKVVAGAENFIGSMAQRAIDFLGDESISEAKRKASFKKLLEDSFDMNTIGRFSLGRYWRVSSKTQRKEYLSLFNDMIIDVYSNRFGEYQGQKLEVRGGRPEGKSDTVVTSMVVPESGPEIQVDWRVRYKNGRYMVVDVVVEGVSMAMTQRSDFASVIQRGGGDVSVLLAHLKK